MYLHLELGGQHAGELPRLLGKNPERLFEWEVLGSMVHVFFPISEANRSRVVALFWPDTQAVMRRSGRNSRIEEFVNPRPYAVNSVFCAALETAFGGAISGERLGPEMASREHDLQLHLSPICTYLSKEKVETLFTALGYEVSLVEVERPDIEFQIRHPRVFELSLHKKTTVTLALRHVMVLSLVIDSDRHEYLGQGDIDKLKMLSEGWLENHPERTFIISRYLIYRRLIDQFLQTSMARPLDPTGAQRDDDGYVAAGEPIPIRQSADRDRMVQFVDQLLSLRQPPHRILQVGCRDGKLLAELVARGEFEEVVGTDPSAGMLSRARKRIDRVMRYRQALRRHPTRFDLLVSSLGYRDSRLRGFDVVALFDLIETLEKERIRLLMNPIFLDWRPRQIMFTAPNREWYEGLGERETRYLNDKNSWDRSEIEQLCRQLVAGQPYSYQLLGIGSEHPEKGFPTHLAVFSREET